MSQPARRIAASEVLVGTSLFIVNHHFHDFSRSAALTHWSVEVFAGCHVENAATHGQVHGPIALAVEFEQCLGGVDAKYRRGRAAWKGDGLSGSEVEVQKHDEEREKNEVDRRGDRHAVERRVSFGFQFGLGPIASWVISRIGRTLQVAAQSPL